MRVLIIGEDYHNSLADSYKRGFESAGIDVARYCDTRGYAEAFPGAGRRGLRHLVKPLAVRRFNRGLLRAVSHETVDLVFVVKGQHVTADTVVALREKLGVPVVNFYPDDPFSEQRAASVTDPAAFAAYDVCFTFQRHRMQAYRDRGARRVEYLPFARDPELQYPVAIPAEPEFDIVFVGNIDAERVPALEVASRWRLAIFGAHTRAAVPRGSPLARATFFPAAYGAELPPAFARAAISLNVLRRQNRLDHNMRSYESPACGAFTLSSRSDELLELFRDGEEMAFFSTDAELSAQIERWLRDPAGRRRVAAAGFRRVEHDTYAARAGTILEAVGLRSPRRLGRTATR